MLLSAVVWKKGSKLANKGIGDGNQDGMRRRGSRSEIELTILNESGDITGQLKRDSEMGVQCG